jgi:hypothetical protein
MECKTDKNIYFDKFHSESFSDKDLNNMQQIKNLHDEVEEYLRELPKESIDSQISHVYALKSKRDFYQDFELNSIS